MKTIITILTKPWIFAITLIILLTNLPPLKWLVSLVVDENHYCYSNNNGSFTFAEFKARDRAMMYRRYTPFRETHPELPDTNLYRLFKRDLFCFWRWGEYFYDSRYKLPYKNWKGIKRKRGYDLQYSNSWQDF